MYCVLLVGYIRIYKTVKENLTIRFQGSMNNTSQYNNLLGTIYPLEMIFLK